MLMSQKRVSLAVRQEFVLLANQVQIEMRTLCNRYGISTKTGYQ
jgi:transposase